MDVKQISVFMENKPGKLAELAKVLRQNGINMRALSLAEAPEFGVVRIRAMIRTNFRRLSKKKSTCLL